MIIESVSLGSLEEYGDSCYKHITMEVRGLDEDYFDLCEKFRCHKEVSVINKEPTERNDAVDALCYFVQAVKPKKNASPIKKVIFNDPATIILWKDGTKTVVKCQEGDTYDKEKVSICV